MVRKFPEKVCAGAYWYSFLQLHKLLGGLGEGAAALLGDKQHVLNAHAILGRHIDARLVGYHHARGAGRFVQVGEPRPLGYLTAHPMAQARARGAGLVLFYDVPGNLVHIAAGHTGLHLVDYRHVGLEHCLIYGPLLVRHLAQGHSAGHVGVVAV